MKRLAFLLLASLLMTVWRGNMPTPARAQTDDISGTWTAFPVILDNFGVVGSFGTDLTENPRHTLDLILSEDGKLIEMPTSLLTDIIIPTSLKTLRLAKIDEGVYRATLNLDPCPPDNIDCGYDFNTVELHLIADDQIELYQQRLQFEVGNRSKMLLIRGDVTDDDPLAAEFSAPRCPGAPVSRMVAGEKLAVMYENGLNVRAKPAKSGAKVGDLDFQEEALALDGPVCADGFQYWQVQLSNGKTGWAAEGTGKDYWMAQESYIPLFNFDTSRSEYKGVSITVVNNQVADEQIDAPTMRGE